MVRDPAAVLAEIEPRVEQMSGIPAAVQSLYHYTTLSGFKGIVESNSIWATNSNYLNDKHEIVHGFDLLGTMSGEIRSSAFHSDDLIGFIKQVAGMDVNAIISPNYIVSFSENGNQLSQWRGYGSAGNGLSVRFNVTALRTYFQEYGAGIGLTSFLVPVIYDQTRQEEILRSYLESYYEVYQANTGDLKMQKATVDYCALALQSAFARMKDGSFREEAEIRAFYVVSSKDAQIEFREARNMIVPYIVVSASGQSRVPIEEVIVGPTSDFGLSRFSLQKFLEKHGHHGVKITYSDIPFRSG